MEKVNIKSLFILTLVIGASFFAYQKLYKQDSSPIIESEAKTTSTQPTAQENFSGGTEREPGNTLREDKGTAVISDNAGVDSVSDEQKQNAVASDTGEITLFSPSMGDVISNGQVVSGKSSLNSVNYRLIDDVTGVIATGTLKVVDGRFSGKISYNTGAIEGRLDIFATRPDLTEYSNIEVNIRFK